ncbi:MAG: (deoxy)nucleoside triphosphate pyrophosphohydrolase [Lachnotalea sp.]
MKHTEVSAAILIYKNNILCAQRNKGKYDYVSYKYEFPGGKIEPGESPEEALKRELSEEMDIDSSTENMQFFYTVNHKYPDFEITMHSFICPMKSDAFNLKEHIDYKWMNIDNLESLDWAPADIPIVMELKKKGL